MKKRLSVSKFFQKEASVILTFIGISIIIGFFTVVDYGVSLDEAWTWDFGTEAVKYYIGQGSVVDVNYSHGGGFLIPAKLGQMFFSFIFPNWREPFGWHMVAFITFQISVYLVYLLAKKFMGNWAATFTALIYGTQPLLWGHGFINPKDIPFTTFLLGSILFGINLTESYQDYSQETTFWKELLAGFKIDRQHKNFKKRVITAVVFLSLILILILSKPLIHNWIEAFIGMLYHADSSTRIGSYFSSIAANADKISIQNYIDKATKIYDRTIARAMVIFTILAIVGMFSYLPSTIKKARTFLISVIHFKEFIPAVIFIGMCMSARALGIIALIIVGLYWGMRNRQKLISVFVMLALTSALIMFILWPDLWDAPLQTYGVYLKNIVGFSGWNGKILFEGTYYNKDNYPNYLVPKLIGMQLTIPTLILGVIGIFLLPIKVWRKEYPWLISALLACWFIVPMLAIVILHPVIYNNFRHFIFILPPFFIFAGITLDQIFTKLTSPIWRSALLVVILLPALIGIVQLHPYEYIYYNELAGGPGNLFRDYELDYWKTSFRACIEYLNDVAPPDAVVSFNDGDELIPWFVREDLIVQGRIRTLTPEGIDYVVVSTNLDQDLMLEGYFPNMIQLFSVERDGVPLSIVYKFVGN